MSDCLKQWDIMCFSLARKTESGKNICGTGICTENLKRNYEEIFNRSHWRTDGFSEIDATGMECVEC